jgi:hypothetical protein
VAARVDEGDTDWGRGSSWGIFHGAARAYPSWFVLWVCSQCQLHKHAVLSLQIWADLR